MDVLSIPIIKKFIDDFHQEYDDKFTIIYDDQYEYGDLMEECYEFVDSFPLSLKNELKDKYEMCRNQGINGIEFCASPLAHCILENIRITNDVRVWLWEKRLDRVMDILQEYFPENVSLSIVKKFLLIS